MEETKLVVNAAEAAAFLDMPLSLFFSEARKPGFPPAIGDNSSKRKWFTVDIEAWAKGKRWPVMGSESAPVVIEEPQIKRGPGRPRNHQEPVLDNEGDTISSLGAAAEICGVVKSTIVRWRKKGKIAFTIKAFNKPPYYKYVFNKADLLRCKEEQEFAKPEFKVTNGLQKTPEVSQDLLSERINQLTAILKSLTAEHEKLTIKLNELVEVWK